VGVRIIGIVVIDSRPFDLAPLVLLDTGHEAPHERREVKFVRVFGRHDEAKLMLFAEARLLERLAPNASVGPVHHSLGAILLDAVAFDVPQVHRSRLRAAGREPHDARFDDHTPRVGPMGLGTQRARCGGPPHAPVKCDPGQQFVA